MSDNPIVKVQLDSTGTRLLIYDEDRTIEQEIVGKAQPDLFRKIVADTGLEPLTKRYCRIAPNSRGGFMLTKIEKDQPW